MVGRDLGAVLPSNGPVLLPGATASEALRCEYSSGGRRVRFWELGAKPEDGRSDAELLGVEAGRHHLLTHRVNKPSP